MGRGGEPLFPVLIAPHHIAQRTFCTNILFALQLFLAFCVAERDQSPNHVPGCNTSDEEYCHAEGPSYTNCQM